MTRAKLVNEKISITFNSHFLKVEVIHHIIVHMPVKQNQIQGTYIRKYIKDIIKIQNRHIYHKNFLMSKQNSSIASSTEL